jgi:hypothetical protein
MPVHLIASNAQEVLTSALLADKVSIFRTTFVCLSAHQSPLSKTKLLNPANSVSSPVKHVAVAFKRAHLALTLATFNTSTKQSVFLNAPV